MGIEKLKRIRPILSLDLIRQCCVDSNVVPRNEEILQSLETAWRAVTSKFSDGSNKPVVIIVGAGAGAPRSLALQRVNSDVFHKIRCFYDASHLSLSRVNDLIEQCHRSNQSTIVLYITQPFVDSATTFINEAIAANQVPSASEFALSHFNALNTFLIISKRYKTQKPLFTASIISCGPGEITCHKNLKTLRETNVSLETYETELIDAWEALKENNRNRQPPSQSVIRLKPAHLPRIIKTLNQTASFTAHILARNLRSNLVKEFREQVRTSASTEQRATAPASQPPESPAHSLTHARAFGLNEAANEAPALNEANAIGPEELFDYDRPVKIVVREKTTHPHEMETLRVR